MPRQITVDIVGNARGFNRTIDEATTKLNMLKSVGAKGVLKGFAIGAGIGGFNLLTSAIEGAVSQMDVMHQAFLDDEASQTRMANVVKNSVKDWQAATKAVEAFAQAGIDLGFQDNDTRDSFGQLIGVTHDYKKALELTQLSMDISRSKNIDLAQATDAVTRAFNGQGRGLVALGIDTRNAVGGTELLARAYHNVRGAANAYATTSAGRVAKANAKMDETMEKLGKAIDVVSQVVIPIMLTGFSGIVDAAGAVIAAVTDLANRLNTVLGPALVFIGNVAARVLDIFFNIAGAVGTVIGAIGSIGGGGGGGGSASNVTNFGGGVTSTKYGPVLQTATRMHSGGTVPGLPGTDVLAMLQAGEQVTPKGQTAGQTIIVNIASFIGSDRDIDRFSDRLAFRLRSTSLS